MKKDTDKTPVFLGIYTRYSELGASSRLRYYLFKEAFNAVSAGNFFHPFFDNAYLKRLYSGKGKSKAGFFLALAKRLYQVVFPEKQLLLEYELLPFMPAAVDLFFIGKRKFVLNFDDFVWEKYKNIPFLKTKYDKLIQKAAGVIVANHLLLEKVKNLNSNVILIPTVVDLEKYPYTPPVDRLPLTAAWIGTPVTYPFLQELTPVLQLAAQSVEFEVLVIARKELPPLPGVKCRCVDWSAENEHRLLQQCHIGIMPLNDTPFARGKSAYKLIQYLQSGLPAIASPVGENNHVISENRTGFLARNAAEWISALQHLSQLENRRAMAMHIAARAQEFSLEKWGETLCGFLHAVLK